MSVPIESSYATFLLVYDILWYCFEIIADHCSNFKHFAFLSPHPTVHLGSLKSSWWTSYSC